MQKKEYEALSVYQRVQAMREDERVRSLRKDAEGDAVKFKFKYYSIDLLMDLGVNVGGEYGLFLDFQNRTLDWVSNVFCKGSVDVILRCLEKPEECYTIHGYGTGESDKADGKAMTYATRRALHFALAMGTSEDDPDRPLSEKEKSKAQFKELSKIQDKPRVDVNAKPTPAVEHKDPMFGDVSPMRMKTAPEAKDDLIIARAKGRKFVFDNESKIGAIDGARIIADLISATTSEKCEEIVAKAREEFGC